MFNPTRRGIPFFCDFYATSMLWQPHKDHLYAVKMVFEHTRKVLLFDVACCVFSELKHQKIRSEEV